MANTETSDIRRYVAGFLFYRGRVLLVRKNRPEWQAGMMNGIGGVIKDGEPPHAAMTREFDEEANLNSDRWQHFCVEHGPGYRVHFFRLIITGEYQPPEKNDVGEELEWCDPRDVKYPVIGNLHWLLPMAMDPRPVDCVLRTTGDIRKVTTW